MAPNNETNFTGVLDENDEEIQAEFIDKIDKQETEERQSQGSRIVLSWRNILGSTFIHGCGLYLIYSVLLGPSRPTFFLYVSLYALFTNFGVAGGAHRMWAHKSYKAKLPLRLFLLLWQTLAGQNSMYDWVRDHRVHHKFTETNADPHNIKRGFFFAHVGWLLCKKHPDVKEKGKLVDMSDLEEDPYVMWQHRLYPLLYVLSIPVIPTVLFKLITSETWFTCFVLGAIGRYSMTLNITWLINSYAHYFGDKPYDKSIQATNSIFLGYAGLGEGFHNYHHVFPWDYRASELNFVRGFNLTTMFIDFFAMLGLAYDLKTVTPSLAASRALRTGDGTHHIWGWGDQDMREEHRGMATTIHAKIT